MRRTALTLIEGVVFIAIVLVFVALMVPAFFAIRDAQKQQSTTKTVIKTLNYRVEQIEYEGNFYLVVSGSDGVGICPATPPKSEKEVQ